jgi:hypothetical protein
MPDRMQGTLDRLNRQAREELDPVQRQQAQQRKEVLLDRHANKVAHLRDALRKVGLDFETMTDADFRDRVKVAKVRRKIQAAKASWGDMAFEWWMNAILSAPTTHMANTSGNLLFGLWENTAQRLAEVAVNLITAPLSSHGTKGAATLGEIPYALKGLLPGMAKGASAAWQSFGREEVVTDDSVSKVEYRRAAIPSVSVGGLEIGGRQVRIPTRALTAEDEFFKSMWVTMGVSQHAYRIAREKGLAGDELSAEIERLVDDVGSLAWERAAADAKTLTFQTRIGPIGQSLERLRRDLPAMRFIVPFITTPGNIFKTGIRKSPLGGVRLLWKAANHTAVKWGIRDGDYAWTREEQVHDTAEQVLAWGMLLVLLSWIQPDDDGEPKITGTMSSDPAEAAVQRRVAPPLSLKIGSTWYSYARLEPFATAIGTLVDGVNGFKNVQNSGDAAKSLTSIWKSAVGQVRDKTFLRGFSDLVNAVDILYGFIDPRIRLGAA